MRGGAALVQGVDVKKDQRKARWVVKPSMRTHMRRSFKNKTALYRILDTNPKTGHKIIEGAPVKEDVVCGVVSNYLGLIKKVANGAYSIEPGKVLVEYIKDILPEYDEFGPKDCDEFFSELGEDEAKARLEAYEAQFMRS